MTMYSVKTGSVALSAATTKSLWMLNPVTDYFLVAQFGISFDAAAATAGIGCELYRVVTIGSAAGTAYTPVKVNRVADTGAASTAASSVVTTEPTTVEVLAEWFMQPFGGLYDIQYPLLREPLASAAGQRIGLRYITPAGVSPNCRAYVWFDER
jgi:hypothetical protein